METTEKTYGDYFKIVKNQDGYRIIDLQEQFKVYFVEKNLGNKSFSEKHYETLLEAENMIFKLYQKNIDIQRKIFEEDLKKKENSMSLVLSENYNLREKLMKFDPTFFRGNWYCVGDFNKDTKENSVKEAYKEFEIKVKDIKVFLYVVISLLAVSVIMQWFK